MKKSLLVLGSMVLSLSLFASSALGAGVDVSASKAKGNKQVTEKFSKNKNKANEESTVTDATYGNGKGKRGYNGLLKAYENTKDKPAGAVIARLLQDKYDITVSDSVYALTEAADELAAEGNLTDAVDVQEEAVLLDVTQVDSYKKLTKLRKKTGETGVFTYVNGKALVSDVAPVIKDGRTLVPAAAIAKSLDATVTWDAATRTVTITRGEDTIKLVIDSNKAYVNGKELLLDVPAQITGSRTIVPISFVSKALKAEVKWEPETTSVVIYDEEAAPQPE